MPVARIFISLSCSGSRISHLVQAYLHSGQFVERFHVVHAVWQSHLLDFKVGPHLVHERGFQHCPCCHFQWGIIIRAYPPKLVYTGEVVDNGRVVSAIRYGTRTKHVLAS